MKRLGILSDTHLNGPDPYLDRIIAEQFPDVDLIIHAGDLVHLSALDVFTEMGKEVVAVCGNMDGPDVRSSFPTQRIIRIEGLLIGIMHGWGSPVGIRQRIRDSFETVDAVIYGHTHEAFIGTEGGVFFFNPGSPTDSRFTSMRSMGIMIIDGDSLKGEIITL
ncbi:MAG TPA: metallophosphoesterase [Deltaproteobacteria bacterium]|nr:metallophosphoesterase [Deltaproteobacteria bacterium]HPR55268.1 metallophosphoesterase [Deltaproteobacteria bacterium]HXK46905.1 metallophosphoesterase [Deltaproteobacteria bacterium]